MTPLNPPLQSVPRHRTVKRLIQLAIGETCRATASYGVANYLFLVNPHPLWQLQINIQNQFLLGLSNQRYTKNLKNVSLSSTENKQPKRLPGTGEAIKESVVRESTELAVDERVENGESMAMPNEFFFFFFFFPIKLLH